MSEKIDITKIDELICHTGLLLENARANLQDIQKAIHDPLFLKSAFREREFELKRKMNDILNGQAELRNAMGDK